MTQATGFQDRFVSHLADMQQRGDRAALAALRRTIGRDIGEVPEADRHLVPLIPVNASDRTARAYYMVAGLFANHPLSAPVTSTPTRRSFGTAIARLQDAAAASAIERRFVALLNAHADDLPHHLRRMVQLLRRAGVAVDWAQLLRDVEHWGHPDRFVQRRWARAFWSAAGADENGSRGREEN